MKPIIAAPSVFAALAEELHPKGNSTTSKTAGSGRLPIAPSNVVPFKVPEWAITEPPAAVFADLPVECLSDGLGADVEEIRSAVAAIPSAAIATENDWLRLARGLAHEAAIYKRRAERLWEILDTASSRAPRYDQKENRRRWDRYVGEAFNHENPITIATVFELAKMNGWPGCIGAPSPSSATTSVAPAPSRAVSIASLPTLPDKREWLHGTDLIRGAVSLIFAPGARGKTAWLTAMALACASGKALLGAHVFGGPLKVLYLSAEDSTNEINLRIQAAMKHHGLTAGDVPGLYIIGAENWGLPLLKSVHGAPMLDDRGCTALAAELDRIVPDVLIIDPLISVMGGVDANNNSAAAVLMGYLVHETATRRHALMIAHHAAKGRDPLSTESAMGAASITNLSRIVLSIEPLAEKDAGLIGLPPWEAKSVFRVAGTKQNLSPASKDDRWHRLIGHQFQNPKPPIYLNGDNVAVVEQFTPGSAGAAFPDDLIGAVLSAIGAAIPPLTPSANSAARHAVPVIANAMAPLRGGKPSEVEAKAILGHLIDVGLVEVQSVQIPRPGKGTDSRKGLVLTPTGQAFLQERPAVPQSPQSPAVPTAGTEFCVGGGLPCGPPATLGGYGGNAGGDVTGVEPVRNTPPLPAAEVQSAGSSGSLPQIATPAGTPGSPPADQKTKSDITAPVPSVQSSKVALMAKSVGAAQSYINQGRR